MPNLCHIQASVGSKTGVKDLQLDQMSIRRELECQTVTMWSMSFRGGTVGMPSNK